MLDLDFGWIQQNIVVIFQTNILKIVGFYVRPSANDELISNISFIIFYFDMFKQYTKMFLNKFRPLWISTYSEVQLHGYEG